MPSLQKALGKLADPMIRPAVYDMGPMLSVPQVFIGTTPKSNPPVVYSTSIELSEFGRRISPDWLPFLLEEAQPEITRATFTFGLDSSGVSIAPLVFQVASFPLDGTRFFEIDPYPKPPKISENLSWIVTSPSEVNVSQNLLAKLRAIDPATLPIIFQQPQNSPTRF